MLYVTMCSATVSAFWLLRDTAMYDVRSPRELLSSPRSLREMRQRSGKECPADGTPLCALCARASQAIDFVTRHPEALSGIFTLSLSSTMGQLFILYTIREFGSLVFATIMTSRQFLSILLSCLLFMHPLSGGQWAGTVAVFGALYYSAFARKHGGHGKGEKKDGEGGEGGAAKGDAAGAGAGDSKV